MGNTDSTQKLGERVLVAKRKLKQNKEIQLERYEFLKTNSPDILIVTMESIKQSFQSYSPFLEATLLLAWIHDSEACKNIVLNSCGKVLSAPISKTEYLWFKQYVFDSSLWFFKTKQNKYMYEELLNIANEMSSDIVDSMDSIYKHLQTHNKWNEIINIKEQSLVTRQDDKKVGLFQNKGFKDLFESKSDDEKYEDMKSFVDSNLAVNILTSTATNVNREFQNHVKTVMSHYGKFQAGPIKNVERCVSKLENDYQNAVYPKSAKLLDLVRCSVTFNTVDQLIKGYNALMKHISKHGNVIELARIKNGFSDANKSGYRDIKLNVIYKSDINPGLNIICEIQLLIINYLEEKKRIHKLYSIVREELYFKMVTTEQKKKNEEKTKDINDLEFVPLLDVKKHVTNYKGPNNLFKCSVDPETDLLAVEGEGWFGCVDMTQRKVIFKQKTDNGWGVFSHNWFSKNNEKHLAFQTAKNTIKIFEVKQGSKFKFKENKSLRISLQPDNVINFVEFDKNSDNILMVYDESVLQTRAMNNVNKVLVNIKLDEKCLSANDKQLSLSDDGNMCVIAGGATQSYFYIIDIPNQKQHKLTSNWLTNTYVPCFINGETKYVAVTDRGKVQIWDIEKRICFKNMLIACSNRYISCSVSTNNILAIGANDNMLRLYDVRTWKQFYSQKYDFTLRSLHLTADLRYLAIGGAFGTGCCTVLQIQ